MKSIRFGSMCFIMIVLLFTVKFTIAQDTKAPVLDPCEPSFAYVYIEKPIVIGVDGKIEPQDSYVIALKNGNEDATDPIGLIIPYDAIISVYSSQERFVSVYAVRPEASPSGLRFVDPQKPVTSSISTNREQNGFQNSFLTNVDRLNCDSKELTFATRSVNVLGGRELAADEERQSKANNGETRRVKLGPEGDFFTHELITIGKQPNDPALSANGIAGIVFANKDFAFQIVHFGKDPIDLKIPTFVDDQDYTLISDHFVNAAKRRIGRESKDSNSTDARDSYLDDIYKEDKDKSKFFDLMRENAFDFFPAAARSTTLDFGTDKYLELEFSELTPLQIEQRTFNNCSNEKVRPLKFSKPNLYLSDGRYFSAEMPLSATISKKPSGTNNLEISIPTQANDLQPEPWLVECDDSQ